MELEIRECRKSEKRGGVESLNPCIVKSGVYATVTK